MSFFRKDGVIGLDVGFSSVKAAQFFHKDGGFHLVKVALEEVEPSLDEAFPEQQLRAALKKILTEVEPERSRFVVCLNCPHTYVRRGATPVMSAEEIRKAVRLEAKNYFPVFTEETVLDIEVTGDITEKGVKKTEVLAAASPRATVARYLSTLSAVGIRPSFFLPVGLALKSLVEQTRPGREEVRAFLEIGGRFSELVIFKGAKLILSRKIPVAGLDFTKAMTVALASERGTVQLSLKQAERVKRQLGIPPENDTRILEGNISGVQILSMLRSPLQRLVDEVGRCFDFYREEHPASTVDSLTLLGGGASLGGLAPFLSNELGIRVELEGSFDGFEPGKFQSHRLALAIGAAMSSFKGINLLPGEVRDQTKHTVKKALWESAVAAAVLISFFTFAGMKAQLSGSYKRLAAVQTELGHLAPELELLRDQNFAKRVLSGEPYWEDVFKELSNLIPGAVYLTELNCENGALALKGMIVSAEKERVLSDLMLALEKGIFKNVQLVSSKDIQGTGKSEFELKGGFD